MPTGCCSSASLRTKFEAANPNVIQEFVDDYFVKDHLGNIRMVLTDEVKQDVYQPASVEPGKATEEEALYDNLVSPESSQPGKCVV